MLDLIRMVNRIFHLPSVPETKNCLLKSTFMEMPGALSVAHLYIFPFHQCLWCLMT